MPEISRFLGIIIRMYVETRVSNHRPHFHAYYQNDITVYSIDTIEILAGSLPTRQRRYVEAWAELHQEELIQDWYRLQAGQLPFKITPLH